MIVNLDCNIKSCKLTFFFCFLVLGFSWITHITGSTCKLVLWKLMIVVTYQKDSRFVFDWFNFVDLFQECDDNFFLLILQTLKQYELAKLTPIEAGCCRPPSVYVGQSSKYNTKLLIKTVKRVIQLSISC